MHITMIAVMSLDGKLTNGADPHISTWTSAEDKAQFSRHIAEHNLIVMGRRTYAASRSRMKLEPGKLRLVLTRRPENFQAQTVAGQLEFTSESPRALTKRFEQAGYSRLLLLGGAQANASFLNAGLVSELLLTIEPVIFGSGTPLAERLNVPAHFHLISLKKLNSRGTLLLHYKFKKAE